jgi:hypothetical protein
MSPLAAISRRAILPIVQARSQAALKEAASGRRQMRAALGASPTCCAASRPLPHRASADVRTLTLRSPTVDSGA